MPAHDLTPRRCWDALLEAVTEILDDLGEEPGDMTRQTQINADLGLSSVEAIHLAITLENRLHIALRFEDLAVRDGDYVDDLALGEIHDFVLKSADIAVEAE
ncbi:phosphopantetheine-binding protein [Poseidonocella sedimentorum]|uniref:Phosphopantetheine attachment site n=1 Tax=Poseidonocella sedimentorum TaxID=871652 RepID=A0A1I6DL05_9RHOB|nr:phosphopantetheine-binding protein [Poseidonocella sedimentorum]SFR06163.1 Phosphopantetheine attachment site [Poseidonocella sedimentorum]